MVLSKLKNATVALLIAGAIVGTGDLIYQPRASGQLEGAPPEPAPPPPISPQHFARLHRLIKPGPGELRFHEIPWLLDITQARKQAAALGKPILVWSGAGGAPIGIC
jgi:hypothetical protein